MLLTEVIKQKETKGTKNDLISSSDVFALEEYSSLTPTGSFPLSCSQNKANLAIHVRFIIRRRIVREALHCQVQRLSQFDGGETSVMSLKLIFHTFGDLIT